MESLYLLIPVGLIFIALAVKVLFWAIKNGQYDDLDTEAHRILFDDKTDRPKTSTTPVSPTETSPEHSSK